MTWKLTLRLRNGFVHTFESSDYRALIGIMTDVKNRTSQWITLNEADSFRVEAVDSMSLTEVKS